MSHVEAIIAPSVLAGDFARIGDESKRMIEESAQWLHMDVMDGHFVPAITFGAQFIGAVHKEIPNVYLDCHMMVSKPGQWIEEIAQAGGSSYTFHFEATSSEEERIELIDRIHASGMKAAIAISPNTPASSISDSIGSKVDMLLIMTVHPGKGGQKFMEECMSKVTDLRRRFPGKNIEVDGGVGPKTVGKCACAGANVMVSGTAVFGAESPKKAMEDMRQTIKEAQKSWARL